MAYTYFVHHQSDRLFPLENGGEQAAALFCWAFLVIAVLGPGRCSETELLTLSTHRKQHPRRGGTCWLHRILSSQLR